MKFKEGQSIYCICAYIKLSTMKCHITKIWRIRRKIWISGDGESWCGCFSYKDIGKLIFLTENEALKSLMLISERIKMKRTRRLKIDKVIDYKGNGITSSIRDGYFKQLIMSVCMKLKIRIISMNDSYQSCHIKVKCNKSDFETLIHAFTVYAEYVYVSEF